jgi:hypothetical protein
MTEDWRKALGIDYNNELDDGIQKYKGDYYLDGVFMQKIIPDEVFFVHQFLTFNKGINGYELKRDLRDYEIEAFNLKDQEIYREVEDRYNNTLHRFLREGSDKLFNELIILFKKIIVLIIRCLNLRGVLKLDEVKISTKYSKIPFKDKIQDKGIIYQYENWEADLKFTLIERQIQKKAKEVKKLLKIEEETYVEEATENNDLVGKIKRLKRLYKSGTLTKDEFEKAKNKLLK